MFAEDFLSNHIFEIMSLLLTAAGIWFIVQQLREAKLASQMEGLLHLTELSDISDNRERLLELVNLKDWPSISAKEAYSRIFDSDDLKSAFIKLSRVYELAGIFVHRKALDRTIVHDQYSWSLPFWWRKFETVILFMRRVEHDPLLFLQWEWLAKEFEKKDRG